MKTVHQNDFSVMYTKLSSIETSQLNLGVGGDVVVVVEVVGGGGGGRFSAFKDHFFICLLRTPQRYR